MIEMCSRCSREPCIFCEDWQKGPFCVSHTGAVRNTHWQPLCVCVPLMDNLLTRHCNNFLCTGTMPLLPWLSTKLWQQEVHHQLHLQVRMLVQPGGFKPS